MRRKQLAAGSAVLMAALAAVVWAALAGAGPHAASQVAPAIDHFTCYGVSQVGPTRKISVGLRDQFSTTVIPYLTVRTLNLCAPTDKNGGGVVNTVDHLECRQLAQLGGSFVPRNVLVTNQFGSIVLRVFAPWTLCAPALKSFTPTTFPAPPTVRPDHFTCYVARFEGIFRPRPVPTIVNQFEQATVLVRKPVQLCTPTEKRIGTTVFPIRDPVAHLVCYELMPRLAPVGPFNVFTSTQFGVMNLLVRQRDTLCLPSTKTLLP